MFLLYVMPPLAVFVGGFTGNEELAVVGAVSWMMIAWTYLPTLDLYRANALWALSLPFAGMLYALMTLDSARRHVAGRGGAWKGRTYS